MEDKTSLSETLVTEENKKHDNTGELPENCVETLKDNTSHLPENYFETSEVNETIEDGKVKKKVMSDDKLSEVTENGVDSSGNSTSNKKSESKISDGSCVEIKAQTFSGEDYEFVNGQYYYTDASGKRYRYDEKSQNWTDVTEDTQTDSGVGHTDHQVVTDDEGRTYYYADNLYLCRDPEGNVYYLDEKNEWKPWAEKDSSQSSESKWYFYQEGSTFYRDNTSGVVYKLNKEDNKWEKYEGKLKKKRPLIDNEEEFDSDEDDESDNDSSGLVPPGAKEDPNITYDGTTYIKKDPSDNMVYEWDTVRRAWFPKIDEDFMATYQLSYGFNPDGTKNENPLKFDDDEEEEAKAEEIRRQEEKKETLKQTKKKPSWFEMDETRNTKVYVTSLPENMNESQFVALMQKCGLVLLDDKTRKPKVKLYKDEEGNFKGDALCTYIKVESVSLAVQILDGYQVGNQKIHVEPAKFEQKGTYNPRLKPRKKSKKEVEKLQKKQEKLFDWRPDPMRGERKKHENTVIIRNVFNPKEFEVAMEKILDHKQAMLNQASNFGKIKKLDLFDLHPEGVVKVTFEEVESADLCVVTLNRRLYSGRTLFVSVWDGKEKFKIEETAEEREKRIQKWNEYLEAELEKK